MFTRHPPWTAPSRSVSGSAWIHHGSSSRERVGAREYPSDLGEYGLATVDFHSDRRASTRGCDTKSLVLSGLVDWRVGSDDVAPSQWALRPHPQDDDPLWVLKFLTHREWEVLRSIMKGRVPN